MSFLKQHLAAVMAGVVVLGGSVFVATQQLAAAPDGGDTIALAQDSATGDGSPADGPRRHGPGGFPKAIRGEVVVPEREGDGYTTVRFDRGILARVDGTTVVIDEPDGTTVEVPTDDDTRVYRDGESAELSELVAGDHVATMRVKEGDAFVTKGVRAISPEQWEDGQERRDDRRGRMREPFDERRDERGA
jgi:hypothetical protein